MVGVKVTNKQNVAHPITPTSPRVGEALNKVNDLIDTALGVEVEWGPERDGTKPVDEKEMPPKARPQGGRPKPSEGSARPQGGKSKPSEGNKPSAKKPAAPADDGKARKQPQSGDRKSASSAGSKGKLDKGGVQPPAKKSPKAGPGRKQSAASSASNASVTGKDEKKKPAGAKGTDRKASRKSVKPSQEEVASVKQKAKPEGPNATGKGRKTKSGSSIKSTKSDGEAPSDTESVASEKGKGKKGRKPPAAGSKSSAKDGSKSSIKDGSKSSVKDGSKSSVKDGSKTSVKDDSSKVSDDNRTENSDLKAIEQQDDRPETPDLEAVEHQPSNVSVASKVTEIDAEDAIQVLETNEDLENSEGGVLSTFPSENEKDSQVEGGLSSENVAADVPSDSNLEASGHKEADTEASAGDTGVSEAITANETEKDELSQGDAALTHVSFASPIQTADEEASKQSETEKPSQASYGAGSEMNSAAYTSEEESAIENDQQIPESYSPPKGHTYDFESSQAADDLKDAKEHRESTSPKMDERSRSPCRCRYDFDRSEADDLNDPCGAYKTTFPRRNGRSNFQERRCYDFSASDDSDFDEESCTCTSSRKDNCDCRHGGASKPSRGLNFPEEMNAHEDLTNRRRPRDWASVSSAPDYYSRSQGHGYAFSTHDHRHHYQQQQHYLHSHGHLSNAQPAEYAYHKWHGWIPSTSQPADNQRRARAQLGRYRGCESCNRRKHGASEVIQLAVSPPSAKMDVQHGGQRLRPSMLLPDKFLMVRRSVDEDEPVGVPAIPAGNLPNITRISSNSTFARALGGSGPRRSSDGSTRSTRRLLWDSVKTSRPRK